MVLRQHSVRNYKSPASHTGNTLSVRLARIDMNSTSSLTGQTQGGVVVLVDMVLGLLSVVINLVVITAIRRQATDRDNLNMFNLILIHLCVSNLVSAVLV